MELSFIGDIMLGRFVQEKYYTQKYSLVSEDVLSVIQKSNYLIANLESPITDREATNSLAFAGSKDLLSQLEWVDCFSLANNHINDFGEAGMVDTIANLENHSIKHNGLFEDNYAPHIIEKDGCKIAVVMCTDMLNYEIDDNCKYKVLRADALEMNATIRKCTADGYFTILFAHCGSLFSRYPNPQILDLLHAAIDAGAGCVITAHSHCLGGEFQYNGVPIFWSLGDFLMDGGSYRRRQSCFLTLTIENSQLKSWTITPTVTNMDLQVAHPSVKEKEKMLKSYESVSRKMGIPHNDYATFYKTQYKKEMILHSLSTLRFLYDTKGLLGFMKMLKVRYYAVFRMIHRMIFDRSKSRYDTDGINQKHLLNIDDIR